MCGMLLSLPTTLTTHYPLLTTHYSLLTTHHSLLTTHYTPPTTHYTLHTTRNISRSLFGTLNINQKWAGAVQYSSVCGGYDVTPL